MSGILNYKCPYCEREDIYFITHHNDINAEEYVCKGKCQRDFYVQCFDNMFIMKNTMNDNYLYPNTQAFAEKKYFEKIAIEQGIDPELPVCGNCVSYEWRMNLDDKFDRHCGSCFFQNSNINFTTSNLFIKGKLHGLTNSNSCDNFFNFRRKIIK